MTFVCKYGNQTTNLEKLPGKVSQWSMLCQRALPVFLVCLVLRGGSASDVSQQGPSIPPIFMRATREVYSASRAGCPNPAWPQARSHQCLLLNDATKAHVCSHGNSYNYVHLQFCSRYPLAHVLPEWIGVGWNVECNSTLQRVIDLDQNASAAAGDFANILERFDCQTGYSVNWNCTYCKEAYRAWICAMTLPFYVQGKRVWPCRDFCHQVEQRCPYFHPVVKEQYAGEPTFKCIDRNIPDLPSITPNSSYGQAGECYEPCHVDSDVGPTTAGAEEAEEERSRSPLSDLSQLVSTISATDSNHSTSTETSGAYPSSATRTLSLYLLIAVMVTLTFSRTSGRTRLDMCR